MKKITVGMTALLIVVVVAWMQIHMFMNTSIPFGKNGVIYEVKQGSSLSTVAYWMGAQHYIQMPRLLIAYGRITGEDRRIHAGEYLFEDGLTPRALLNKLSAGAVHYYPLTIVEGWNLDRLLLELSRHPKIKHSAELSDDILKQTLNLAFPSAEGLFFPDTYYYYKGMPALELLRQSHERLMATLMQAWQERADNLPFETPYEALIMASLIEKETGIAEERGHISGVLSRRLHAGMRLQTDPSVIYGLGPLFDGNLRSADLRDVSNPYNSYRRQGLPPTPIAMPGRESIWAALHPMPGKTFYFVAKGDGSHHFSETLAAHQAAVRKYQIEQRRDDYTSSYRRQKED